MIERFLPAAARVRLYAVRQAFDDVWLVLRGAGPARGPAAGLAARRAELARLPRRSHGPLHRRPRRAPTATPSSDTTHDTTHAVTFEQAGMTVEMREDQTVLEAGLAAGVPLSFSCTVGGCAACKRKVVAGELEMEFPNCLTEQEHAEGYRLLCISRPRGPVVIS